MCKYFSCLSSNVVAASQALIAQGLHGAADVAVNSDVARLKQAAVLPVGRVQGKALAKGVNENYEQRR